MNLVERIFALKQIPCFSEQSDFDLTRIAEAVHEKHFEPDAMLCAGGQTLRRVYIVTEGGFKTGSGDPLPSVLGASSVLLGLPAGNTLRAAHSGAHCLILEKGLFFTIIYQCPSIILKLPLADGTDVGLPAYGSIRT